MYNKTSVWRKSNAQSSEGNFVGSALLFHLYMGGFLGLNSGCQVCAASTFTGWVISPAPMKCFGPQCTKHTFPLASNYTGTAFHPLDFFPECHSFEVSVKHLILSLQPRFSLSTRIHEKWLLTTKYSKTTTFSLEWKHKSKNIRKLVWEWAIIYLTVPRENSFQVSNKSTCQYIFEMWFFFFLSLELNALKLFLEDYMCNLF